MNDWLARDVRYAVRGLLANPGLAAAAILSLAVGIGPCTALFSIIEAFGFRPLPIDEPARLIAVTSRAPGSRDGRMSYPDYVDVRDHARLLSAVAAEAPLAGAFHREQGVPEVVIGSTVSGNYFDTLGVRPAAGRTLSGVTGNESAIVISDRLWARLFDRDPSAIGEVVKVNTTAYTIVGVMPRGFTGTQLVFTPEFWLPITTLDAGGRRDVTVLARARQDVTIEQVRAELEAVGARLAERSPDANKDRRIVAEYEQVARRRMVGPAASMALAIVSLILLVAAANVAGLLVGRSEARREEFAIRAALGASRRRLAAQLLIESAVMAAAAAVLGVVLALWILRLLPTLVPPMPLPVTMDFRIDVRVLLFTALVAAVAVPLVGAAPALLASHRDMALRVRGGTGAAGRRVFRDALVAVQVCVTLVLLVGAGLLLRQLVNARAIDPGFSVRPMVFSTTSPAILGYNEARTREFYRQLLERLAGEPGIEGVTVARHMPLNTLYGGGAMLEVRPVEATDPNATPVSVRYNTIGDDYFETLGIRVVRGRAFGRTDVSTAPSVAVVNHALADQLWPGTDAIGRRLRVTTPGKNATTREVTIVGIAQDGRYLRLTEDPQPYLYLPWTQRYTAEMTVIARFSGPADQAARAFRRAVTAVDPAVPTMRLTTLDEHLRLSLIVERTGAAVAAVLGFLGLGLSVIGLYGVVSYLVSRRTREIGIRLALGARTERLVGLVVWQGGRGALAGVLIGLPLAWAGARLIASERNGVSATDPVVFGAAIVVVVAVALAATWVPARRAARVDPVGALRAEQ